MTVLRKSLWFQEIQQASEQTGQARLVLRQLTQRISEVDPELRTKIQTLSLSQLEVLGEALLEFSNPSELVDWLSTHASLNAVPEFEEIKTVTEAIKIVASDAAVQVVDDIDYFISPFIPSNLPAKAWDLLRDEFMGNFQTTVELSLQWLVQTANAEVKEIQLEQRLQQQFLEAQLQQEIEETQIQSEIEQVKILAQEKLRQSEVIYSHHASQEQVKVIPNPMPKERKVIPHDIPSSSERKAIRPVHSYSLRQPELQPEPYGYNPQLSDTSETKQVPQRKRRRSGVEHLA